MRSVFKALLGLLVGIVLIGFIASGCSSEDSDTPAVEAQPTAVLEITAEPEPTPVPTEIPTVEPTVQPTALPTPEPTPIPTPEPQVEACPTQPEYDYLNTVVTAMSAYTSVTDEISALFTQAGEDSSLFLDNDWKLAIAVQFAFLNITSDEIFSIIAPTDRTTRIQDFLDSMMLATHLAVQSYSEGIDNLDPDKMMEGTEYINAATQFSDSANEATLEMCGE